MKSFDYDRFDYVTDIIISLEVLLLGVVTLSGIIIS